MSLYFDEQQNNSFQKLDSNDFFENFEKYIVIKFKEINLNEGVAKNIPRNLKKEFDIHCTVCDEKENFKTDPIHKSKCTSKIAGAIHNFFCLCFICQTKKFIDKKRSNSIKLDCGNIRNTQENKPKKTFILRNRKKSTQKVL